MCAHHSLLSLGQSMGTAQADDILPWPFSTCTPCPTSVLSCVVLFYSSVRVDSKTNVGSTFILGIFAIKQVTPVKIFNFMRCHFIVADVHQVRFCSILPPVRFSFFRAKIFLIYLGFLQFA